MKVYLSVKETTNGRFYYADFGSERHGKTSFRLWVHPSFIQKDDKGDPHFTLPMEGVSLSHGKSNSTVIMRPGDLNLFEVFVSCGYRGGASFEIITPYESEFVFKKYHSQTGSLGVSVGALVTTKEDHVTYRWSRSGRLYGGSPTGTETVSIDGTVEVFEETDLCEIEDLAEV